MAVVKNLMIRAGADFSPLIKQTSKASNSMKSMTSAVKSSCNAMTASLNGLKRAFGALGIGLSIAAITSAAKDAYAAYQVQAEAETKLTQVMRNTMNASNDEVKAILDLASAQQQLGVVGDEVQLAGAQELSTYLVKTKSLETLIPVMNDMIAQQYGLNASEESAVTIATMLGKVMSGQTSALSRLGYSFDAAQEKVLKYGTEAERAAMLAKVVEDSVGGMNAALAQTPAGRMKQLSNTLGDIKEQFGKAVSTVATAFLPVLNKVAKLLADVATLANKVAQAIANVFGGKAGTNAYTYAGEGAADTASAVDGVADSYDNVANSANNAANAQKKALSLASIDTLHRLTFSSNSNNGSGGSPTGANDTPSGSGIGITDGKEEAEETASWLEEKLQALKDLFNDLDFGPLKESWEGLKRALEPLVNLIKDGLKWCWDNVLVPLAHWTIEKAVPAVIDLLAAAFEALTAVLNALKPVFQWIWDNILVPIAQWTGDLFIFALEEITDLLHDFADLVNGKISFSEFISQLDLFQQGVVIVTTAVIAFKTALLALEVVKTVGGWISAATSAITGIGSALLGAGTAAGTAGAAATAAGTAAAAAGTAAAGGAATAAAGMGSAAAAAGETAAAVGLTAEALTGGLVVGLAASAAATYLNVKAYNQYIDDMYTGSLTIDDAKLAVEKLTERLKQQEAEMDSLADSGAYLTVQEGEITATKIALSRATEDLNRMLAAEAAAENTAKSSTESTTRAVENQASAHGTAASYIANAASKMDKAVSESSNSVKQSINSNVVSQFTQAGTTADQAAGKIKKTFEGLGSVGTSSGNQLANGFTTAIQTMVTKVQSAVNTIKSLISGIGSSTSTISTSTSTRVGATVPKLAKGAVIPPNSQFTAILGDQTHGYNIETPEELLRTIFREETGAGNGDVIDVLNAILRATRSGRVLELDNRELGRTIRGMT